MIEYKYNEEALINDLKTYVDSTYEQHYSQNKFQATEFIIDGGHGEGFALGNILKYSQRYGKKAGKNRNDLLKVLHYALIALHVHDKEHVVETPDWDHAPDLIPEQIDREKATVWDEGGPKSAQVLIQKCDDPRKWYASKVGRVVDVLSEDLNEYKARDNGGHINFISKVDAIRV